MNQVFNLDKKFCYKWYTKSDLDAFFGLLFDGFSKVLAAAGIMIFSFGMPSQLVLGRILPGLALATFFGNLWYAYEAYSLATREKRQDVTAQPYGVGAGQVFGWLFLIMGPVFWDTNNAVLAWQVGIAACFVGGVIEVIGAFVGKKILHYTPRAALLGNLAAGAIVWLSLVSILNIFDKPYIALLSLIIVLAAFIGKVRMPFGLPVGLVAIVIGTVIAWGTGQMQASEIQNAVKDIRFVVPQLSIQDLFIGMKYITKYLPIIIPLQIANFLTTLQGLESAAVAGDQYPVRKSMVMDGVGTIIGSIFGNPFPTTVYYGHPSWKEIGARAGYSVLNGVTYLILGLSGTIGILTALVPYQAVMPVLVFVGLVMGTQAFSKSKQSHSPAILLAFLPLIAQYIETAVNAALTAAGTNLSEIGYEAFNDASFPIQGVLSLSQGAFLSSLLLAAWMSSIVDKEYIKAAFFGGLMAFSSLVGLIHAPKLQWVAPEGIPFAIIYLVSTLLCIALGFAPKRKATF